MRSSSGSAADSPTSPGERDGGSILESSRTAAHRSGPDGSPDGGVSMRARPSVRRADEAVPITAATPDAWEVLRQARANADGSADGVSLNHVITTDSYGLNPFTANPFTANPFTANPFTANPFTANAPGVGIGSYGALGFGGRQPVTYRGPDPRPRRRRPRRRGVRHRPGRAPLVRGECAPRPDAAERRPHRHPATRHRSGGLPLALGAAGRHLRRRLRSRNVHRRRHPPGVPGCAHPARPRRGRRRHHPRDRPDRSIEAADRLHRRKSSPYDVLNLSFSFYHETPDDPDCDFARSRSCSGDCGTTTTSSWSARQETRRPTGRRTRLRCPNTGERHLSVGALNPADHSVALFSNIGDWVDVYAPGVSLVSTVPVDFDGGIQAGTRDDKDGRRRETLDVDDFRGGYGVWSGTSFAAPVVAGRIAARIAEGNTSTDAVISVIGELDSRDHSR